MSTIDALLELIGDPERRAAEPLIAPDDPLMDLLVHLAFSDGVLADDELALLVRLRPDQTVHQVREWLQRFDHGTFDARAVAAAGHPPFKVLQLATRMVCMDGDVAKEEIVILEDLAEAMHLDEEAPKRAVDEVVAPGGALPEERVLASLRNMLWRKLEPTRDEPSGELGAAIPGDAEHVATMLHGNDEVAALYLDGFAAYFEDGARFVRFDEIETYTRVPVPGASFHVHTLKEHLKIADGRMRELGQLLDFLYGRDHIPDA